MKPIIAMALAFASMTFAQEARDYQLRCRQEAANRLSANRDDVTTGVQDSNNNNSRISWTYRNRNGYCLIDNRMNVTEFREFNGNNGGNNSSVNSRDRTAPPAAPIPNVPRVKANTS